MPSSLINQKWAFGRNVLLDFATDPPTAGTSQMNAGEGCAAISDFNGSLLFYTNGMSIWDPSGTSLPPVLQGNQSSTQSAIIVRDPAMAGRYFIFTTDGSSGANSHFNGLRLDTNPTNWTWVPIQSIATLPPTAGLSPVEKLTAVPHANCRDFWILTMVQQGALGDANGPASFRVFLLTASGLGYVGDTPVPSPVGDLGYLKANGAGTRLALANWPNRNVLLYDFSNTTGAITNEVVIPVPQVAVINHPRNPYGVEFSPSGDVLYYTVLGGQGPGDGSDGFLFQVDLTAPPASTELLRYDNQGGRYALGALQLAIDGRIYMAKDNEAQIGAIHNPDVVGVGCNVDPTFLNLATGTRCIMGLPNLLPDPCTQQFDGSCEEISDQIDAQLERLCSEKVNLLEPCSGPAERCPCSGDGDEVRCEEVPLPDIRPCITVSWGDTPCDCMETDDVETFCITVCNCYSNVTFSNVTIGYLWVHDSAGQPVATLPDGSPSVAVTPTGPICFGDVGPCTPEGSNCVSREFVVVTRGARGGRYELEIGSVCFDVCFHYQDRACFELELCGDR